MDSTIYWKPDEVNAVKRNQRLLADGFYLEDMQGEINAIFEKLVLGNHYKTGLKGKE